jgi:carbamoyltransferase
VILGLNAFHGDSSAAVFSNGTLIAAIEEERLNRIKHWAGLPALAARECLKYVDAREVRHIAVSRDPRANFLKKALRAASRPSLWKQSLSRASNSMHVARIDTALRQEDVNVPPRVQLHNVEHHRAHMASAFFASPFEEAAVVSVDSFGDFSSIMWGVGRGPQMEVMGSVQFPHSIGIFYSAFTQFLGFPKWGDEYKMMGLAAYGEPRFFEQVDEVVQTRGVDVRLNLDYFTHHIRGVDLTWEGGEPALGPMYSRKMVEVFGNPREPRTEVRQQDADLAASIQAVLEKNYFALLRGVAQATGQRKLCIAGGVALNCAANGKLFEQTPFQDLYIQPAASDGGTSIGAALYVNHQILGRPRSFVMRHVYYGPEYSKAAIRRELDEFGVVSHEMSEDRLLDNTARELADGKILGWFQGRMEFGPRALGNRSILADPRRADMKDTLNKRIKYREHFRPFCPSVLSSAVGEYFETEYPSPFMVQAYRIKPDRRDAIPAVTHADGTGRLQTVEPDVNPLYWRLIERFGSITGVPVLLNTSFNENEPIVNTPRQAIECFLRTQMDGSSASSAHKWTYWLSVHTCCTNRRTVT